MLLEDSFWSEIYFIIFIGPWIIYTKCLWVLLTHVYWFRVTGGYICSCGQPSNLVYLWISNKKINRINNILLIVWINLLLVILVLWWNILQRQAYALLPAIWKVLGDHLGLRTIFIIPQIYNSSPIYLQTPVRELNLLGLWLSAHCY